MPVSYCKGCLCAEFGEVNVFPQSSGEDVKRCLAGFLAVKGGRPIIFWVEDKGGRGWFLCFCGYDQELVEDVETGSNHILWRFPIVCAYPGEYQLAVEIAGAEEKIPVAKPQSEFLRQALAMAIQDSVDEMTSVGEICPIT